MPGAGTGAVSIVVHVVAADGLGSIAHDRAGHGRLRDLAALTAHLDLQNAIHIGHSAGGGEVVRYLARHGESRVAKAMLISSVRR